MSSLVRLFLTACLSASVLTASQVIADPDAKMLNLLSAFPGSVWTHNFFHRNWLMFPVNETHQEQKDLVNAEYMSDSKIQCAKDLIHTAFSLTKEKWAMQMVDSVGKPEAGILYGRFMWTGNYEECLEVSAPAGNFSSAFRGQYCWLTFNPKIDKELKTPFKIGVCLPNSCDSNQLMNCYNEIVLLLDKIPAISKLLKAMPLTSISCVPETVKWSASAIGCLIFLTLLASVVVVATSFDLVSRFILKRKAEQIAAQESNNVVHENISNHETSEVNVNTENTNARNEEDRNCLIPTEKRRRTNVYQDLLLCFSAAKNVSAVMDISARSGQLDCLHGIRFLSITWVILGHTFLFGIGQIANPMEILKIADMFSFQAVVQAPYAVDSFFLLSGFLLAYLFLKDGASIKGVGGWIYFYAHRYIRLTPVYAIALGMWASIYNFIGTGPFWQYDRLETVNCNKYWWWNLFYINNFSSLTTMCMGWSWYLSNDMQFYIISPLLLVPLKRRPFIGVTLILGALIGSWLTTFLLSYEYNYTVLFDGPGGMDGLLDLTNATNPLVRQFDMIYMKPYCRIGPYLIGMLVAYLFLITKDRRRPIPKCIVALGWISATTCGLLLVYGLYHTNLGIVASAFYTSLSRSAWALSLGWVIFACLSGYGGPVNSLLSLKYFFPLSRLTYCTYLFHPMIIYWYFGTLRDTMYLSLTSMVMLYLAFFLLSYGFAFVATLLFESPIVVLEKQFRRMFKK